MSKWRRIALLLLACMMALTTGCSAFSRRSSSSSFPTSPRYAKLEGLTDGNFYIMRKAKDGTDRFYLPYSYSSAYKSNPFTLWYKEDWGTVPTLYADSGDKLVFRGSALPETFQFTRFYYEGYTLGFCGVSRNDLGRYYINTQEANGVFDRSTASKLARLNSPMTVLYSVGETTDLGAGNFSLGGTVNGLLENTPYECVFYTGSKRHTFNLKADSIALSSWENFSIKRNYYIDGDLIYIPLPDDMHTGYYTVNGSGLFRYVKGTAYDDGTDFNVPNNIVKIDDTLPETEGNTNYSPDEDEEEEEDIVVYPFDVTKDEPVNVRVTYDDLVNPDPNMEDPVVRVISNDTVRTIDKLSGENAFNAVLELPKGSYTVEIEGLDGRTPHVIIS